MRAGIKLFQKTTRKLGRGEFLGKFHNKKDLDYSKSFHMSHISQSNISINKAAPTIEVMKSPLTIPIANNQPVAKGGINRSLKIFGKFFIL